MKIALTGDSLITRFFDSGASYEGFEEVKKILLKHEINFTNLEGCVRINEGKPSLFPGGSWVAPPTQSLSVLKNMGFNLLSIANNHVMDYGIGGLEGMLSYLNNAGFVYAGAGVNLYEASKPAVIDKCGVRTALVACTTSSHDSNAAGYQGRNAVGRPGVNLLRHKQYYHIEENDFDLLKKIAQKSGVDNYHLQAIKEGYLPQKECISIGNIDFYKGSDYKYVTKPNENDADRILSQIRDAKIYSDIVILSIHTHQFSMGDKENSPEFIEVIARKAIEEGASIVVCHGPHVIRGIEKYNDGIIFYGLGDFILQNEYVSQPYDFHVKYDSDDLYIGLSTMKFTKNGTRGLPADVRAWKSFIASVDIDPLQGIKNIELYPISLYRDGGYKGMRGWPHLDEQVLYDDFADKLKQLSKKYGTLFTSNPNNINIKI